MSYSESHIDRKIRNWFQNDNTCGLLREIRLAEGHLRGLESFRIDLNYPISAIAGKNGCGKSTLLALAACAYHNSSDGFKLSQRVLPYYRFSDFFIQHRDELSPEGVEVLYKIAHDN